MATPAYLLVYDHGTTGVRACIFNQQGHVVAQGYEKVSQIYPKTGWVEHNPKELWQLTLSMTEKAFSAGELSWQDIAAVGITNQRETIIFWDKETGEPIYNAIVWQCRRTAEACDALRQQGAGELIRAKTGLLLDPYFSASKAQWLFNNIPEAHTLLQQGRLLMGTVDTWILWHLSGRKAHITDLTNASRTLLFNIHTQTWDPELLALFNIPAAILPKVTHSSEAMGMVDPTLTGGVSIPITGNAGDQQAALFGQKCWEAGDAKSTYGTGAFLMMNLGNQPTLSQQGLLTTLACHPTQPFCYASEGSIFMAGSTIEWLQKELGLIQSAQEIDPLALSIPSNEGVYLVPAFVGLGAPHWDAQAKGAIVGLSRGSGKAHLARAAVEAMAYQTKEVLDGMHADTGLKLQSLRVDGGVTRSNFLMQFLANMLNIPIIRTESAESTALGAAYLAGLAIGFWDNPQAISDLPEKAETFTPKMDAHQRDLLYSGWQQAVQKSLSLH